MNPKLRKALSRMSARVGEWEPSIAGYLFAGVILAMAGIFGALMVRMISQLLKA